jgi:hypothetical protein
MKRLAITAALCVLTGVPASAVEVWQGDLFISAATTQCASAGFAKDDFFRAVYRPANISDNGAAARLTLLTPRAAARIAATEGDFVRNGDYSGKFFSSRAGLLEWDSTILTENIGAVTETSPRVDVLLGMRNFTGVVGCSVTVRGTLTHRPD